MKIRSLFSLSLISVALVMGVGCGEDNPDTPDQNDENPAGNPDTSNDANETPADGSLSERFGLSEGIGARLAVEGGLNNPSDISFSPNGEATIADAGNGRVVALRDGELVELVSGFATQFWKANPDAFKVGPLSAIWLSEGPKTSTGPCLVVTDAGKNDGEEQVIFFYEYDGADAYSAQAEVTNPVAESGGEGWTNEGNLCGLSATPDGTRLFVCGQGNDDVTVVLEVDAAESAMRPLLSADTYNGTEEPGISINSPMESLYDAERNELAVLYSGAGGTADGLLVIWDLETKTPAVQYELGQHGVIDPMSIAKIPGSESSYVVVDNNWAPGEVQAGALFKITLMADGKVEATKLADKLQGPVACAFDSKGDLWITQLGPAFDKNQGSVLVLSGVK